MSINVWAPITIHLDLPFIKPQPSARRITIRLHRSRPAVGCTWAKNPLLDYIFLSCLRNMSTLPWVLHPSGFSGKVTQHPNKILMLRPYVKTWKQMKLQMKKLKWRQLLYCQHGDLPTTYKVYGARQRVQPLTTAWNSADQPPWKKAEHNCISLLCPSLRGKRIVATRKMHRISLLDGKCCVKQSKD